jgi:hypothetical protein
MEKQHLNFQFAGVFANNERYREKVRLQKEAEEREAEELRKKKIYEDEYNNEKEKKLRREENERERKRRERENLQQGYKERVKALSDKVKIKI